MVNLNHLANTQVSGWNSRPSPINDAEFLTRLSGSGKDDFSSSTQKQSIDTIATSRNTSLKQYRLNKSFNDSAAKSPSFPAPGSSAVRFPDGNETTNCHACLSTAVTNSKINIMSDCNINEIHLNIFPPSATYVKEPQGAYLNNNQGEEKAFGKSFLNIDVHEKTNKRSINGKETVEAKRRMSSGCFSHISLNRCDSILHISIGNSSKITKRHKRNSWLLSKIWKLAHKGKSPNQPKCFFSPQIYKDGTFRLSNGSLNLVNDELMISINNHHGYNLSTSILRDGQQRQLNNRDLPGDFLKSNDEIENGANELDCYMNEIKQREMRWYEAWDVTPLEGKSFNYLMKCWFYSKPFENYVSKLDKDIIFFVIKMSKLNCKIPWVSLVLRMYVILE